MEIFDKKTKIREDVKRIFYFLSFTTWLISFTDVRSSPINLPEIYMEFAGIFIISYCLWISQALNDSQKEQEKEVEKRLKEKLKNDQYINVRIIEKL